LTSRQQEELQIKQRGVNANVSIKSFVKQKHSAILGIAMSLHKFVLFVFLSASLTCKGQSMFSVIHLNEERDVHNGVPKSITTTTIFYNSNGKEKKKELAEYDHFGLPVQTEVFGREENLTSIVYYKYDTVKRVILESRLQEINARFPTGRVVTKYQYDSSRSPILIQYLDASGTVLSKAVLRNHDIGLPAQLDLYGPVNNLIGFETASYIVNENKAIVTVGNREGKLLSSDTVKISFKNAYKFQDPQVKYNNYGDVIYSESKWLDGTIHYSEYEYVYDDKGNWIDEKAFNVVYKSGDKKKRSLKTHVARKIIYW
jgi:hypothetical protein